MLDRLCAEGELFAWRLHDALRGRGVWCWLDEKHMLLRTDEPRDPAAVLLAATMRLRARAKGAGDDALNLDGYLLSGEWTSGKAKPVQGRLAADFTGWEQDVQNFNAKLPGGSRLQFLGGRFSSLAVDSTPL